MFRLPVCPYCGTVYRYQDTKKAWKKKENTCYHCKKPFRVHLMPYVMVEALILLPLCIGVNILLLNRMTTLNLVVLFLSTAVFLLLGYLVFPFFMHFKKSGKNQENSGNHPKSNHHHPDDSSSLSKNKQHQQKNMKRRS